MCETCCLYLSLYSYKFFTKSEMFCYLTETEKKESCSRLLTDLSNDILFKNTLRPSKRAI